MVDCHIGYCYSSYLTFFLIWEPGQARFCFREQVLVVFLGTKGFENKYYPRWRFFFKLRMTFCRHEDTDIPLLLKSEQRLARLREKSVEVMKDACRDGIHWIEAYVPIRKIFKIPCKYGIEMTLRVIAQQR